MLSTGICIFGYLKIFAFDNPGLKLFFRFIRHVCRYVLGMYVSIWKYKWNFTQKNMQPSTSWAWSLKIQKFVHDSN
jgi:hypothetical protein